MKRFAPLLFVIAACEDPALLNVPDPGLARTAIYIVLGADREPVIFVSDLLRAPAFPELSRKWGTTLELYTVYYACSPEILGLPTGLVQIAEDGLPLPPGQATHRSMFDDGGQSEWSRIDHELPAELKIARAIKCAKFDLRVVPLVSASTIAFGVWSEPIGPEEVLVGILPSGFWRVTPEGAEEAVEMRELPSLSAFREREDRLWLFGSQNRLAVGDPRTGVFEQMPQLDIAPGPLLRSWLAGPLVGTPFELFMFHDRHVFARFDGNAWTILHRGSPSRSSVLFGGLAWLGPSDAIAVMDQLIPAHRVRGTVVSDEMLIPPADDDRYSLAANVPGFGAIVGTYGGRIYVHRADGGWDSYFGAPIENHLVPLPKISSVAPLDDGLLIGGGLGRFTQLQPKLERDDKYCHYESEGERAVDAILPANSFGNYAIIDIQPLGCGFVFLSKAGTSGNIEVGFLRRK